jgi:hypothetical protein
LPIDGYIRGVKCIFSYKNTKIIVTFETTKYLYKKRKSIIRKITSNILNLADKFNFMQLIPHLKISRKNEVWPSKSKE